MYIDNGKLENIRALTPYMSKHCGPFEVRKIYRYVNGRKTSNPMMKVQFIVTGTVAECSYEQFKCGYVNDPCAGNVMGIGHSDGYRKEENHYVWKLWLDMLLRVFYPPHPEYSKYGGSELTIRYNEFLHFGAFLNYYLYRKQIKFPITSYKDESLYRPAFADTIMCSVVDQNLQLQ